MELIVYINCYFLFSFETLKPFVFLFIQILLLFNQILNVECILNLITLKKYRPKLIDKRGIIVINSPILIDYDLPFFWIINDMFIFLQQVNLITLKVNIVLKYSFYLVENSKLNTYNEYKTNLHNYRLSIHRFTSDIETNDDVRRN